MSSEKPQKTQEFSGKVVSFILNIKSEINQMKLLVEKVFFQMCI